jgi:hypothetical protein
MNDHLARDLETIRRTDRQQRDLLAAEASRAFEKPVLDPETAPPISVALGTGAALDQLGLKALVEETVEVIARKPDGTLSVMEVAVGRDVATSAWVLGQIAALHSHDNSIGFCFACGRAGPCATWRALAPLL